MRNFSDRSQQAELMDGPVPYDEFADCLRELETINRWTFAYGPTMRWLKRWGSTGILWDIGSGGGDMLRRIRAMLPRWQLTGIDINPWAKQAAEVATPSIATIRYQVADIFAMDDAARADVIISALFTHHLSDATVIAFLRWMEQHAISGWFINDLHRHPVPYYFIRMATGVGSRNRLIRHDAAVSVARAFTRTDWQRLLAEAGITQGVRIRWHFPFRYSVGRVK